LIELGMTLARLAVIGLIAIGVSGLLAALLGATLGETFVAGDASGVSYTQARCADNLEYQPGAGTCARAATLHHYGEIVDDRIGAGVLGLLTLGAYLLFRRRGWATTRRLPDGFAATIGVSVFGLAAAGLLFLSLGQIALGGTVGVGGYLSGGLVSLAVACVFGITLLRTLLASSAGASPAAR
jgi:hypothetical protein